MNNFFGLKMLLRDLVVIECRRAGGEGGDGEEEEDELPDALSDEG